MNGWVNNGETSDLRRYRAHYGVNQYLIIILSCGVLRQRNVHIKSFSWIQRPVHYTNMHMQLSMPWRCKEGARASNAMALTLLSRGIPASAPGCIIIKMSSRCWPYRVNSKSFMIVCECVNMLLQLQRFYINFTRARPFIKFEPYKFNNIRLKQNLCKYSTVYI